MSQLYPVNGAGLGLRRALMGPLSSWSDSDVNFMEVAPENWINVGGRFGRQFREYTERFPFLCHGLSLSIGSPAPLDWDLLKNIKKLISEHNICGYSEHLSYCSDSGHLYDLLPIPFTEEAVRYVSDRISQVQDFLGQRLIIENVSYYATPLQDMSEIDFLRAVLEEADCGLLLDINNIYVNSINHRYNAEEFLRSIPGERIAYGHMAGHFVEAEDLRIDTHGSEVIDPVWTLLSKAYELFGCFPTLLERDFNFPPVGELLREVNMIKEQQACAEKPAPLSVN
ncbi:MAG: hypothetical protein DRR42_16120 [Gammaproteobacteria bacterium]|nr:MAG: hypothetical protein DRR42_16120 [Gammaproteobacteria bacterium]